MKEIKVIFQVCLSANLKGANFQPNGNFKTKDKLKYSFLSRKRISPPHILFMYIHACMIYLR